MSMNDFAWLAGYFDGEAYFGQDAKGYLRISVGSTDKDVLLKVQSIVGGHTIDCRRPARYLPHHKSQFKWGIYTQAKVKELMVAISPYLGERRRNRILSFGLALLPVSEWDDDEISLAWLAGILEADGSFNINRTHDVYFRPRITMGSTDQDIADRCLTTSHVGRVFGPYLCEPYKPRWIWSCNGRSDTIELLQKLNGKMGIRRQTRIQELLARFT